MSMQIYIYYDIVYSHTTLTHHHIETDTYMYEYEI